MADAKTWEDVVAAWDKWSGRLTIVPTKTGLSMLRSDGSSATAKVALGVEWGDGLNRPVVWLAWINAMTLDWRLEENIANYEMQIAKEPRAEAMLRPLIKSHKKSLEEIRAHFAKAA